MNTRKMLKLALSGDRLFHGMILAKISHGPECFMANKCARAICTYPVKNPKWFFRNITFTIHKVDSTTNTVRVAFVPLVTETLRLCGGSIRMTYAKLLAPNLESIQNWCETSTRARVYNFDQPVENEGVAGAMVRVNETKTEVLPIKLPGQNAVYMVQSLITVDGQHSPAAQMRLLNPKTGPVPLDKTALEALIEKQAVQDLDWKELFGVSCANN